MIVDITQQPFTDELRAQIYSGFSRHSIEVTGHDEKFETAAFVAMNRTTGLFAGVVVTTFFWNALHVKHLYVDENHRGQGLGTQLLEHALALGIAHKCPFAFLETMSFQALGFYKKFGFQLELTRNGYAHGTSLHYLRKDFIDPNSGV